mmetsp:Transcript_4577/g.16966  ORF Transcript_4577/g.16966 Transcript_4577/m.16966 type:complete len:252 (-) Transcript_4577:359-1114(-)
MEAVHEGGRVPAVGGADRGQNLGAARRFVPGPEEERPRPKRAAHGGYFGGVSGGVERRERSGRRGGRANRGGRALVGPRAQGRSHRFGAKRKQGNRNHVRPGRDGGVSGGERVEFSVAVARRPGRAGGPGRDGPDEERVFGGSRNRGDRDVVHRVQRAGLPAVRRTGRHATQQRGDVRPPRARHELVRPEPHALHRGAPATGFGAVLRHHRRWVRRGRAGWCFGAGNASGWVGGWRFGEFGERRLGERRRD